MRRPFAWIAGVVGGLAAYKLLRRRRHEAPPVPEPSPALEVDPRAEALRAKLDEAAERPAPEAAEATPAEPEDAAEQPGDPDARRHVVHEAGRAAIEEMRRSEGSSAGQ